MQLETDNRLRIGIDGLDRILEGGLIPRRTYLVRGGPGCGKTTLGVHYLTNGPDASALFVTMGESEEQLRANARQSGLAMDAVAVLDLSPGSTSGSTDAYSLVETWDVEGNAIHDEIVKYAETHQPDRVFVDSLSHMRLLSPDAFQFRKQVMSLLRTLTRNGATVLFTSEASAQDDDEALAFLADGVISLEATGHGRLCSVTKFRGSGFAEGHHYFDLGRGGLTVYPRLIPEDHSREAEQVPLGSGIPEFDTLMGGGIESAAVTLLSGPTGVGKTTLGSRFLSEAAGRDERCVLYSFDEGSSTFFARCRQIGIPVQEMIQRDTLRFQPIEPLRYNPDQFAVTVRAEVEERGATMVMIDSLSGYQHSIRGEDLQARVHALCRYLTNMGVTVILVNEVFSIMGAQTRVSEYGLSYIADTIILLRYIELNGELRKTVGVLKKRSSNFERSLREFHIQGDGLHVGPPLRGLKGILSGLPETMSSDKA